MSEVAIVVVASGDIARGIVEHLTEAHVMAGRSRSGRSPARWAA